MSGNTKMMVVQFSASLESLTLCDVASERRATRINMGKVEVEGLFVCLTSFAQWQYHNQ